MKLLPILYDFAVAPFTGAWIKTYPSLMSARPNKPVAPFTGAWIKTMLRLNTRISAMSHPSRMRGLKCKKGTYIMRNEDGRILLGCVEMADQIACAAASLVDVWSCYTTENLTEV